MSQEFDTITDNSLVLCIEAESHETLAESMWPRRDDVIFFSSESATAQTRRCTVKTFNMRDVRGNVLLQLPPAHTHTRSARNNTKPVRNTTQTQTRHYSHTGSHTSDLLFYFPSVESTSKAKKNSASFVFQEAQVSFTGILTRRSPNKAASHSKVQFFFFFLVLFLRPQSDGQTAARCYAAG